MAQQSLYEQAVDYANRANPYPFYARLRQTPVARQADGTYVVSSYHEIVALLHDPRISSDRRNRFRVDLPSSQQPYPVNSAREGEVDPAELEPTPEPAMHPSFIGLDSPQHERLRRQATWSFGPPHTPGRVAGMEPQLVGLANRQIDALRGKTQADVVEEYAYPIPVSVICQLLGVPREDEPRFRGWVDALIAGLDTVPKESAEEQQPASGGRDRRERPFRELRRYMTALVEAHRAQPGPDLLSELITDHGPDGPMDPVDIVSTGVLLLIAGHETTVNLISNGMLTLLRHRDLLERLRHEPNLIIRLVEELLRYDPPVQMLPNRTALADIPVAGTIIPRGSRATLLLAAGNRDPARFRDPDRFDPDRENNAHLGFGSGIHYCFGAPLARLEAQVALTALVRRLENPRLVQDPPPYRQSHILRGPRHLLVQIDGVRD